MIDFSVVVCTYNRSDYLVKVLNCLNIQYEVIVVNNNSTDDTESICNEFIKNHPDIIFEYSLETNKGLSFARNTGIDLSKGEWVVFLDDDAEPISEYLTNISDFLEKHPECMAAGGRIYPNYEIAEPKWMSKFLLPLVSAIDLGDKSKKFPTNKYPIGANMLFKREIFKEKEISY